MTNMGERSAYAVASPGSALPKLEKEAFLVLKHFSTR
jgi:hypothetical protein